MTIIMQSVISSELARASELNIFNILCMIQSDPILTPGAQWNIIDIVLGLAIPYSFCGECYFFLFSFFPLYNVYHTVYQYYL